MEPDTAHTDPVAQPPSLEISARDTLHSFIEGESDTLLRIITHYVRRANLGNAQDAHRAALEILSEVVVDALRHAERFDPTRSPMAWLLGIATNHIKRRLAERKRLSYREPVVSDIVGQGYGSEEYTAYFDRIASLGGGLESSLESDEATMQLLSLVSPDDAQIVRLAVLSGLDGEATARQLGISAGTARVRLHRALNRLRRAWEARTEGEDNE